MLSLHHFVTYVGGRLPVRLIERLAETDARHRNTFVRGYFDEHDRLVLCEKVVEGEVRLAHRYEYGEDGRLRRAMVSIDGSEERTLQLDGEPP